MPGIDGLDTLAEMKRVRPETAVVMISGHGTIETAVKATKLGAYDFIEKPLSLEKTAAHRRAAPSTTPGSSGRTATSRAQLERGQEIVGQSAAHRGAAPADRHRGADRAAACSSTARTAPARSWWPAPSTRCRARRDGPFVEVNCAAIPEELIESELFGHERGAFTGAVARRRGKFELADGGTLFLDEIGDMSLKTQAKVLRVLEEQAFERVGGKDTHPGRRPGHRRLQPEPARARSRPGRFREDLYYRLNVIPIEVPPLRERKEDIPLLVAHFVDLFSAENGKRPKTVSVEALAYFLSYDWPGNVRELRNMVERLVIMSPRDVIGPEDLPPPLRPRVAEPPADDAQRERTLKEAREAFERAFILSELRANEWNMTRTAERLGIERSHLYRKLKAYGISAPK